MNKRKKNDEIKQEIKTAIKEEFDEVWRRLEVVYNILVNKQLSQSWLSKEIQVKGISCTQPDINKIRQGLDEIGTGKGRRILEAAKIILQEKEKEIEKNKPKVEVFRAAFWAASPDLADKLWHEGVFTFEGNSNEGKITADNLFRDLPIVCEGKYKVVKSNKLEIEISQGENHSAYIIAFVNAFGTIAEWKFFSGQYLSVSQALGHPITVRPIVFYRENLPKEQITEIEDWLNQLRTNNDWWKMTTPFQFSNSKK